MLTTLYEDMREAFPGKSKFRHLISSYLFDPGFKSVALYRLQQKLSQRWPRVSLMISNFNLRKTGAQFCVGASIGKGLIVRHPAGIVIGGGVSVGENCVFAQGVTIGQMSIGLNAVNRYPQVGNRVLIGANSVLLGDIKIGDDVTIGALTIVRTDVSSGELVVGNPSRVIKRSEKNI